VVSGGGGDEGSLVEGGPAHHLGIYEVLLLAAHLPDSAVLALSAPHHCLGQGFHHLLGAGRYVVAEQEEGVDGDDDLAENVGLQVLGGGVADADGAGVVLVAAQVIEGELPP